MAEEEFEWRAPIISLLRERAQGIIDIAKEKLPTVAADTIAEVPAAIIREAIKNKLQAIMPPSPPRGER